MQVAQRIKDALAQALRDVDVEGPQSLLEHPAELTNGDYAIGVALKYAKEAKMKPREFAEKIVMALGEVEGVAKVEVAGAGFINFYLTPSELARGVEEARKKEWGKSKLYAGKRVMAEYTDPNPFKEFHIGHLMSNAIGEAIARLLEFSGAKVLRANYQGDVGPHVAKAIWGIRKLGVDPNDSAELGKAYTAGSEAYENNEAARSEIDTINAKVYDKSDTEVNDIYEKGRKASLAHFENLYTVLGTKFDHYFFESETAPRGVALVKAHPEVFEQSEGATVFKAEEYGLHTRVFLTKRGLPTYEAKELGLAELKAERATFDLSLTVTAQEQSEYFKVVKKAIELIMPELGAKIEHRSHGMMRMALGKMSSRKGNVVTGESLLDDLSEVALLRAKESRASDAEILAKQIAVAAVKYQILKQGSGRDMVFDHERALSLEGDSGPYLQYAHARAHAVVEKAKEQKVNPKIDEKAEPMDLSRLLHRFPEAVEYAACEMEPHLLTNYLFEFASAFNHWYANEQILDGSSGSPHKVALADAARQTLKNGLWLLGIPAPEKM